MERESFVFHRSYAADVPKEVRPMFYEFIVNYGIDGIEPDFSDKPEAERWLWIKIWNSIKERIDADFKSYISSTDKRRLSFAVAHFKNGKANAAEISLLRDNNFDFQNCVFRGHTDNDHKTESMNINDHKTESMNINDHKNSVYVHKPPTDTDTRSVSEFVPVSEFECVSVSVGTSHTPTFDEVSEYVESNELGIDPERFFDTYDKNGWKINGKPFDWKKRADWWARTQTVKVKSASGADAPDKWALTAENAEKRRARKNE